MKIYIYVIVGGYYFDGSMIIYAENDEQVKKILEERVEKENKENIEYAKEVQAEWDKQGVLRTYRTNINALEEVDFKDCDFEKSGQDGYDREHMLISNTLFNLKGGYPYWYGLVACHKIMDNVEPGIYMEIFHEG